MQLNELHKSHIKKVEVSFVISGKNVDPEKITETLSIKPNYAVYEGMEKKNILGKPIGVELEGIWSIDTKEKVISKDINDHLRYLLSILLPHQEKILEISFGKEVFFNVLWESSYLYSGTGPIIGKDCLQGICLLKSSIGFDIYQVDE